VAGYCDADHTATIFLFGASTRLVQTPVDQSRRETIVDLGEAFEQPYGPMGPPTLFAIPVLRYMKTHGLTHEQLATVSVVQREWAAMNPRESRTQGSRRSPLFTAGAGSGPPLSRADESKQLLSRIPRRRPQSRCRGRHHAQRRRPSDNLRRPCSLPEAGCAHLPTYSHAFGHAGTYALRESARQMRGTAPAQIPDARISVCRGVGGMFAASGTIIMSNEAP
jgi:Thiolase C-terminal domain-like